METLLGSLMERQSSELNELKESLQELKTENAILREEILGVPAASLRSVDSECMELMEKRTLRKLIEEIQFDLKALSTEMERSFHDDDKCPVKRNDSSEGQGRTADENDPKSSKESVGTFPVVEINCKNLDEERELMKTQFWESVKQISIRDGTSLRGSTVEEVARSIIPDPTTNSASCALKLSNFLSCALTDPRFCFWPGNNRKTGPAKVDSGVSEVFTFQLEHRCYFLSSFRISSSLRLTIYCAEYQGSILFGMAFTPENVPIDNCLADKLVEMPSVPDVWMHMLLRSAVPLEVFINHGKLLARGYMTNEPVSIVHIDVLEVGEPERAVLPVRANKKPLADGESISAILASRNLHHGPDLEKMTCTVEIANCLNSTLKNRTGFFRKSSQSQYDLMPSEIRPFYRERFLAPAPADDTDRTVEATFGYEIESTDLCLIVSLQTKSGNNSFVAALAPLPVEANRNQLVTLMEPTGWTSHVYKTHAQPKDGEQVIQIRNIQASVRMTEDAESLLSIRVFAI